MDKMTNRRIVVFGLLAALFIGALDATVVVTAAPVIIAELNGLSLFTWVFSIYTMASCVMTPIFGKLCDMLGRKKIFVAGVSIFVIGSILCGLATSMTWLIWSRILQGIGNGALIPVTFTIVGDLYTGEQRARIQGVFASVWSVAGLLGPVIGGYFTDHVSWRWIFFMNVPIGMISVAIVLIFLFERIAKKSVKVDYFGALMFTVGVASLLFALLTGGRQYAWNSWIIICLFIVAALSAGMFIKAEQWAREPMIPLHLFKERTIAVLNASVLCAYCISTGVIVYLPIWIQSVLGHSATTSGLTTMSVSIAWQIGAMIAGQFLYRAGAKATVVFGGFAIVAGTLWLSQLHIESPFWFMIAILILIGFGMGNIATPATVLIQSAVSWEWRGSATASNTLMLSLGQTVGIAVFGSLLNSTVSDSRLSAETLAPSLRLIFVLALGIAVLNVLILLLLPSHRKIMDRQSHINDGLRG